jgi:hypothetical protein
MKPAFLAVAAAVSLALLAASSLNAPAIAQGKPDDALRAALEESKSSGKGLNFHIRGTTIGGAVTAMGDKFVTVKNQAGIAVIRIDSIDAVAGAITLK